MGVDIKIKKLWPRRRKKEKSVNHIVTPFITRVPGYRNELKKKK